MRDRIKFFLIIIAYIFLLALLLGGLFYGFKTRKIEEVEAQTTTGEKITPPSTTQQLFAPLYGNLGGFATLGNGCDTIFEDDFNDYNDGNLSGQGGWSGSTEPQIDGAIVYEGLKAVYFNTVFTSTEKTGVETFDGQSIFYIRRNGLESAGRCYFGIYDDTTMKVLISFGGSGNQNLEYYTDDFYTIQGFNLAQWYEIKIEWRSADGKIRISVDDVDKTDWIDAGTTNAPDTFLLSGGSGISDTCYIDYISCEPYEEPIIPTTATDTIFLIQNTSTGAMFYLDRSIDYGEILIVFFLLLFLLLKISEKIYLFVWSS